jgi:predicted nuclease with TOPRIM domain
MSYTTNNTANQQQSFNQSRKWVYFALIAALILTWAYVFYDRSKSTQTVQQLQTQVAAIDNSRTSLQQAFDATSAKLDSLTGSNVRLQGTLAKKNQEVQKLKANIANILRNKNATASELAQAKNMIQELNAKTEALFAEVEKLKAENRLLTENNEQLTTEKTQLTNDKSMLQSELQKTSSEKEAVTNVASTLKASNINITPINIKGNGKEKATTVAKRVDVMRVSFDLDENRVASSGKKDLYIRVVAPDGHILTQGDVLDTKDAGAIQYTSKVTVDYEQGKRSAISFDWKPDNDATYQTGNYKIEIYQNGYKIGESTKSLKKGGLFS